MSALTEETVKKLSAPLDPGRVKHREGSGGRSLSYLEGHDVIRTANDVFGVGGWSYVIADLTCLGEEPVIKTYNGQTREGFRVAYRATVCVSAGTVAFSDVGFGDAMEYTGSKLTPHELASKEAVTDGLKRALKNFGDQFGLCLYDKDAPEHNGHSVQAPAAAQQARQAQPAATQNGEWTWPFGKNKGKSLAETDRGYLDWFLANSDKEDIKDRVRAYLGVPEEPFFDPDEGIPFMPTIDGPGN